MPAVGMRTFTMLESARDPERLRRAVAYVTSGLAIGVFRPGHARRPSLRRPGGVGRRRLGPPVVRPTTDTAWGRYGLPSGLVGRRYSS